MKAAAIYGHGGPEVFRYVELKDPAPGKGEVLIKVHATSLNHVDIWVRIGTPAYKKEEFPHVMGSDVAGEVADLGEGVTGFKVGDRVVAFPGLSCHLCELCLSGQESVCNSFKIIGAHTNNGGYGEMSVVPEWNLVAIPEGISFEDMAAVPVAFTTAWHMLITRGGLKAGETVLVQAAGSGIGSAAVRIAKLAGAKVVATVGSDEKAEKAKGIGADVSINYLKEDLYQAVMDITNGRGVDLVFEHVGPETLEKGISCLAKGGRLVVCGATTGQKASFNIRDLFSRQISIIGSMLGTKKEFETIVRLMGEGRLKPVIDRVFHISDVAEAHRRMEERRHFGKIVMVHR